MGMFTQLHENDREWLENVELLGRLTRDAELLIMNNKLDGEEAHAFFRCLVDTHLLLKNLNAGQSEARVTDRLDDAGWCELQGMIMTMQADLDFARNRGSAQMSAEMLRWVEKELSFLDY